MRKTIIDSPQQELGDTLITDLMSDFSFPDLMQDHDHTFIAGNSTDSRVTTLQKSDLQNDFVSAKKAYLAFFWRIHFYAGIFIAPFIFIAAITGTLYAIMTIVMPWHNAHLLHSPTGDDRLSLNRQIAIAQAAHPNWKLTKIKLGGGYENNTWVILQDVQHKEHAIFIDPYQGTILGDLPFKKSNIASIIWLDRLHRNLLLGSIGRLYSELAASWMWIMAGTGLIIWIYRSFTSRRERSSRFYKKSWKKILHARIGILVLLGMIFLSITGITWSHYAGDHIDAVRMKLGWSKPQLKISAQELSPGVLSTDYSRLAANIAEAGMHAPYLIILSNSSRKPIVVNEQAKDFRLSRGIMGIDPVTLNVVQNYPFDHFPFIAQFTDWIVRIHMGSLFGIANRILLLLVGVGISAVIILGYCMWWSRRPRFFPISPGTMFKDLSVRARVGIIIGVCLLGYCLPLLGISLIIFCICDAIKSWLPEKPRIKSSEN